MTTAGHLGQPGEFEEFARARTPQLLRSAWLLCGDRHGAEDLVQETLAKVYVRWHRRLGARIENPAAYAQTALVRTFLSSRRRRSSGELPYADVPEQVGVDHADATDLRSVLVQALEGLAPLDRAVLVLRYLEDLSVAEVADRMGTSPGAVRTRASRALDRIRPLLGSSLVGTREESR